MDKLKLQRIMKWALKIQEKDTEGKMAQARKIAALANRDAKSAAAEDMTLRQVTSYQAIYGRFIAEELLRPVAEADTEVDPTPLTGQDISSEQEEWNAAARVGHLNPNGFVCMESPLKQVTRLINHLKSDKPALAEMCSECCRAKSVCTCQDEADYNPIKDPFSDTLWCPYCNGECAPDYCWNCHSELGEKARKMYGENRE